ncbi:DUF4374 domain-containing protein [Pedobacter immunditicola]|uniref:DUF4374 domain-containing protein n=1 Tax=Pedobacter immunditicola TaxID=3133440 RepID=UPI0030AC555F
MYSIKGLIKATLFAALATVAVSCSKDDNNDTTPVVPDGSKVYILGVGVTTATATTNYVVQTSDLMQGKITLTNNGILQEGYRDYGFGGNTFYSIGGLGVTDVNAITLDAGKLATKTGLTFELANNDFIDVDGTGKTMLGISIPVSPAEGLNAKFYTVDIAANTISGRGDVPMNDIYPSNQDWLFHSGLQVRGPQIFHTFYPADYTTYATKNTDAVYVAIYSYPGFKLEKVITDTRTGPAGAFNTRSGLFKTEAGDLYTVSTTSYANGYSQSTKPAAVLKIKAGTTEFDKDYYFGTDTATNGGKIAHAIYIGNGKLFAAVSTVPPTIADRWADNNLRLAIVDLNAKTIKPVANSPIYKGDGGRSFAALLDEGKVYSAITVNGVTHIYQTDIATATTIKGAEVEGSFIGGIARLK